VGKKAGLGGKWVNKKPKKCYLGCPKQAKMPYNVLGMENELAEL
jgi:hypothetical protein